MAGQLAALSTGRPAGRPPGRPPGPPADQPTGRPTEWPTDWPTDWPTGLHPNQKFKKMLSQKALKKVPKSAPRGCPGEPHPMQHVFFRKQLEFQGDTLGIQRRCPGASLGKISCRLLPSSPSKCGLIVLVEFCMNVFQGFGQMPHLMRFGTIPGAYEDLPEGYPCSRYPLK